MCRRKIPAYLGDGRGIAGFDELESDRVTVEIYDYLEEFGVVKGKGWPGLREVVRAHGLKLICDAIEDGLLSEAMIDRLIQLCKESETVSDALDIVGIWMDCNKFSASKNFDLLDHYCTTLESDTFLFQKLRTMIDEDPLLLDKIGQGKQLWDRLANSIIMTGNLEATLCLQSVFAACCHLVHHKQDNQFTGISFSSQWTSLGSLLGAMAIVSVAAQNTSSEMTALQNAIHTISSDILLAFEDSGDLPRPKAILSIVGKPYLLASLVVTQLTSEAGKLMDATAAVLDAEIVPKRSLGGGTDDIVTALAKHIVSIDDRMQLGLAESLVKQLFTSPHVILQRFAVEVATAINHNRPSIDFRLEMATNAGGSSSKATLLDTNATTPCSYRWDDTLCEWIATTPWKSAGPRCIRPTIKTETGPTQTLLCTPGPKHDAGKYSITQPSPDVLALSAEAVGGRRLANFETEPRIKHSRHSQSGDTGATHMSRTMRARTDANIRQKDRSNHFKNTGRQYLGDRENCQLVAELSDDELGF